MNKYIKLTTFLFLGIPLISLSPDNSKKHVIKKQIEPIEISIKPKPIKVVEMDTTFKLVDALIQVESMGNDSAVGDQHLGEPSIGALQIRPIMVREVNRILKRLKGEKKFKLKDRFSREKSIEMFMIWKNYHHPEGGFETIARNWNGGPRGYKNKKTERYWAKVQLELKK